VSTDYRELGPFGTDYMVELPGGAVGICNPVDSTRFCRDDLLENLSGEGQGVAGRRLLVQDHGVWWARSLAVTGADLAVATPLPGSADDPSVAGATLTLSNPTTGESAELELPAGPEWRPFGGKDKSNGWVYLDLFGRNGPCTHLMVTHAASIVARCNSLAGPLPFTLDEPEQGALDVTLRLGGAPAQCMRFGGTVVLDTPATRRKKGIFLATGAPAAGCPE